MVEVFSSFRAQEPCTPGIEPEKSVSSCKRCQGNGEIITDWRCYLEDGHGDDGTAPCPDCDGRGDEPWEGALTPEEEAMVDAAWKRHEAARPKS